MLDGSMKYLAFMEYQKVVHADIFVASRGAQKTVSDLESLLAGLLRRIGARSTARSYNFPYDLDLTAFESIILDPEFPFAAERDGILANFASEPRTELSNRVLALLARLVDSAGISDPMESSLCAVLLFRSMFSHTYTLKPAFFYPNAALGLQSVATRMTAAELEIDERYARNSQPGATIASAFGSSPEFREAASHLEAALFFPNPFDALAEISLAIEVIERIATPKGNGAHRGLLPMEVTFGFLLVTILISAVPNFEELAEFIEDFTPKRGLFPMLEYVGASIKAANQYCRTLRAKFMDGGLPSDSE
jgi:hypothetical protein